MSIQSTMAPHIGVATGSVREGDGFFTRLYKAMIAGRQARAQRMVNTYLANLSDTQLNDLGFTADEIKHTRKAAGLPVSYWS
ncbi:MAG: DUF1127 domain-containing protein [Hyphomicrobiaceae bacterium]|jgi:uncharacterized protein YjiS (DUF1127 family)